MKYDRLVMLMSNKTSVAVAGFRPAEDTEVATLENGYPCDGRWYLDYVDSIPQQKNAMEFAQRACDANWGTVYSDTEGLVADDLLEWNEGQIDDEQIMWAVRDKERYNNKCLEVFMSDSPEGLHVL